MPIAVDGTTPVRWAGVLSGGSTPDSETSASFTAPTDALLVLCISMDGDNDSQYSAFTVSDSGGLTWTDRVRRSWSESTTGGASFLFTARTVSAVARTVSVNGTAATGKQCSAKLYVLTGVDVGGTPVDSVTASNEGGSGSDPTNTTNVTPGANGLLIVCNCDWGQTGTPTSSNLTVDGADYSGAISVVSGYRTCSNGVALNGNINGGAGPQHKWCQIVVREAAGAAALRRYTVPLLGVG